jgi:hypothetical protein
MAQLRSAVVGSSLAAAGAGLVLALAFGVLLEPGKPDGCQTGLYAGTYGDLLLPLHLAGLVVLLTSIATLSRRLGRPRLAGVGLPLAAAYALACVAYPPLFGWYGLAAMVLAIPVAATLAIVLTLQVRAARRQPSEELRWQGLARASLAAQWAGLVVLLPAAYAFAWLNGAGSFCF